MTPSVCGSSGAVLDGGPGNDTLQPDHVAGLGSTPDPTPAGVINGGEGTDTVDYLSTPARGGLSVSLDGQANDGTSGEGDNVMADVENVIGSAYNDNVLIASRAANRLEGQGANDRLVGGAGKDYLVGWAGSHTLDALDGAGGDRVECGDGADVAYADSGDVVADDCEKVSWAPAVASSKLHYRSKRVGVKLKCPRESSRACVGKLRLTTLAGKGIASKPYKIRRGKSASVTLRLKKKPARRDTLYVAPKGTAPIAGRPITVA